MHVWEWNSPIALSIFIVGLTLSLLILSLTIKTMASIDAPEDRRRK
jgi:high-affinity K+ transport system ATPase subunit B